MKRLTSGLRADEAKASFPGVAEERWNALGVMAKRACSGACQGWPEVVLRFRLPKVIQCSDAAPWTLERINCSRLTDCRWRRRSR